MFSNRYSLRSIGKELRDQRIAAGLSQQATALAAGVGRSTLIHLEHGRKDIRLSNVLRIASTIGASLGLDSGSPGHARRLEARADAARKVAARREAHLRLAAALALARPAAIRALREAREMVSLWKRDRTCSAHYIEGWSRILAGSPRQAAARMHDMDPDWLNAMLQNTPFSRSLAQP